MKKLINSNMVAANAFITTNKKTLSINELEQYVDIVREKTNKTEDSIVVSFSPDKFINMYDFAFTHNKKEATITMNKELDKKFVENCFRANLSENIIKIMEESGIELISMEEQPKTYKKIK